MLDQQSSVTHGSRVVPSIIFSLSLLTFAVGLTYGIILASGVSWTASRFINWCGYIGDACEILADSIIVFTMVRLLLKLRSGLPRPNGLLVAFVTYTINTGLLTTLCVIASLFLLATLPRSSSGLAIYNVVSKLYINSLLGSLNARPQGEALEAENTAPILTTQIALVSGLEDDPENIEGTGESTRQHGTLAHVDVRGSASR